MRPWFATGYFLCLIKWDDLRFHSSMNRWDAVGSLFRREFSTFRNGYVQPDDDNGAQEPDVITQEQELELEKHLVNDVKNGDSSTKCAPDCISNKEIGNDRLNKPPTASHRSVDYWNLKSSPFISSCKKLHACIHVNVVYSLRMYETKNCFSSIRYDRFHHSIHLWITSYFFCSVLSLEGSRAFCRHQLIG